MRTVAVGLLWIASAIGQQIIGIWNPALGTTSMAASSRPQLASGSLVQIIWSAPVLGGPSPPNVSIGLHTVGSDQFFEAQVLSSTPSGAIVAVIPRGMPLGLAEVALVMNATPFPPKQVDIVSAAIGLFTVSGNGVGPALAQNSAGLQLVLNQMTSPALPGEYVTLWATGLGAHTTAEVAVVVGGKVIRPSFAGAAPSLPGVDQINFQMPDDVPYGCYMPLRVSTGEFISNSVAIASAAIPGACTHPLALSVAELRTLDRGDRLLLGAILFHAAIQPLSRPTVDGYTRVEDVTATFLNRDAFDIFLLSRAQLTNSGDPACSLDSIVLGASRIASFREALAGPSLKVQGPSSQALDVPISDLPEAFRGIPPTGGIYSQTLDPPTAVTTASQLPPPFFTPGPWQTTAPGGETIAAFRQAYTLPPQVRWTNRESLVTFGRNADLLIVWDPQGYSANDVLSVSLTTDLKALSCTAPAQSGQFALPRDLLQQMEPTTPSFPFFLSSVTLGVGPRIPLLFRPPLAGGDSAPALISYQFSDSLKVAVQ